MPKFIDHHPMPQMPPEAMQQMKQAAESGQADPNGVIPHNVFVGKDGTAFCYTEAENAEAVIQSHASMGVILSEDQITEVTSLV
ncbi:MAG: DUF4242 domain-containing protein [Dehalococcoidales bacterium]|nr:MAG: DUF4242 domain-containing protein [Dehalococcoidales bacterium]